MSCPHRDYPVREPEEIVSEPLTLDVLRARLTGQNRAKSAVRVYVDRHRVMMSVHGEATTVKEHSCAQLAFQHARLIEQALNLSGHEVEGACLVEHNRPRRRGGIR